MRILVTGAAGFIGHSICNQLLCQKTNTVVAVDHLNDYYNVELKYARLNTLTPHENFIFYQIDLKNWEEVKKCFDKHVFDFVIHLAAQAGVRYSITNPHAYSENNLHGMTNILEACRYYPPRHLLFASSSSVYGKNTKIPFSENDSTDEPVSFYAATKKANEVMAYSYAHLYQFPITGLRFFTVYGPWGRPDMAPWLFTEAILNNKPIKVFNHGKLQRDFTYIDDIVEGVLRIMVKQPERQVPFEIYNIGNHHPVKLKDFIRSIEMACQRKAIKEYLPMQEGDVLITCADTSKLRTVVGYSPNTPLRDGIQRFVDWYREFHR